MSSMLNDTVGTAKKAMNTAKEGTEHAVSSARSTLLDGVHAAAGIVSMLRNLDLDDGLGFIGLARRRSMLGSFAMFSAGLAVGAGAGMLFAPMSGADLRRAILTQLKGATAQATETIKQAESEVENKAEELAGKAKDAAMKAERKVESKVSEGADAVKDKVAAVAGAVKDKAESAANTVKDKAESAANAVKDKAESAANAVKDKTDSAANTVKDKADDAKQWIRPADAFGTPSADANKPRTHNETGFGRRLS